MKNGIFMSQLSYPTDAFEKRLEFFQ